MCERVYEKTFTIDPSVDMYAWKIIRKETNVGPYHNTTFNKDGWARAVKPAGSSYTYRGYHVFNDEEGAVAYKSSLGLRSLKVIKVQVRGRAIPFCWDDLSRINCTHLGMAVTSWRPAEWACQK